MTSRPRLLVPTVALAAFVASAALLAPASRADKPVAATCVQWHGEVRARAYGYDHFVVLASGCKQAATCAVTTDVAPEVVRVAVAAGESKEVATFLGSPASVFHPSVSCTIP